MGLEMIKLSIGSTGNQTITKVCNTCGNHIDNLQVEDIMVKPKWANSSNMTFKDKDGNEITRTELPSNLIECQCENCE